MRGSIVAALEYHGGSSRVRSAALGRGEARSLGGDEDLGDQELVSNFNALTALWHVVVLTLEPLDDSSEPLMIELYTASSPKGWKATIALEALPSGSEHLVSVVARSSAAATVATAQSLLVQT